MRTIKQALDPNGIMNPGKVVAIKADPSPAANQILTHCHYRSAAVS